MTQNDVMGTDMMHNDKMRNDMIYSRMNFRNTPYSIFLQSGLGTGSTVEVNSETLRVRTKPEIRVGGSGGLYVTLGVV